MTEEQRQKIAQALEREKREQAQALLAPLKVYTVEKLLGTGAFGDVLLVRHRVFGLRAMKLIHQTLLRFPLLIGRFENEAKAMHGITHPNVVKVHDMGEIEDRPYLVMDYLEGGTVEDHLAKFGVFSPRQAVHATLGILRGLSAAHAHGIIHRDIKPANILFDIDGTPKITDFGIAHLKDETKHLTKLGATMGTHGFMSPGQLAGQAADVRDDVHAVGVTLYVMLTDAELGEGNFADQIEVSPKEIESIHVGLQDVIRKATAKKPDERMASAAAMIAELEALLASLPEDPSNIPQPGSALSNVQDVPHVSVTLMPGSADLCQEGANVSAVSQRRLVQPVPDASPRSGEPSRPYGTIHPDVDQEVQAAEVEAIRVAAKGRVMRVAVLAVLGVLLVVSSMRGWKQIHSVPSQPPESSAQVLPPTPEPLEPERAAVSTPVPVEAPAVSTVKPSQTMVKVPNKPVAPKPEVVVVQGAQVSVVEMPQVRLLLKADTTVTVSLTGEGGTFTLKSGSREIPAGEYRASVDMPGRETPQMGTLVVKPGITTLTCDSRFKMCTGLK
ncbi:serine/threonine protein kinase [Candidatus Uhrbacteria bacterium]|nr:serine/threonine protein kinase [Candidatus Uhrbacteria bacterium]